MGKGIEHNPEIKAAVMGALLVGQSVNEVAAQYKLPIGTVKSWKSQSGQFNQVDLKKKERIGQLILDVLEAQLETSVLMNNVFREKAWLEKQDASQVAVLYGVLQDKTYRVLEALPDDTES